MKDIKLEPLVDKLPMAVSTRPKLEPLVDKLTMARSSIGSLRIPNEPELEEELPSVNDAETQAILDEEIHQEMLDEEAAEITRDILDDEIRQEILAEEEAEERQAILDDEIRQEILAEEEAEERQAILDEEEAPYAEEDDDDWFDGPDDFDWDSP